MTRGQMGWKLLTEIRLDSLHHICRPLRRCGPLRRRPARQPPRPGRGLQGHLLHARRLRPGPPLHYGSEVRRRDTSSKDTQHRQDPPADNVGCLGGVLPHHAGNGCHQLCAVLARGDAVGRRKG